MAYIGRRGIPQPPQAGGTVSQSPDTKARVNRAQGHPYSIDVPDPFPSEPTTTTQKIGNQLITTTTQDIRGGVEEDFGQQTFIYGDPSKEGTEQSGGLAETLYDRGTHSGFGFDYMAETNYMQSPYSGRQQPLEDVPEPRGRGNEHFIEEMRNINQILNGLYWLEMEEAQGY
jgi:hypothetical protein|tara:strand:- start:224 stop:739 length:516 start_codon:yes stop_codon:yes gene_type:complete